MSAQVCVKRHNGYMCQQMSGRVWQDWAVASYCGWGLYETYRTAKTMAKMGLVEVYRDDDTWDYYRPGVTLSVKAIGGAE